MGSYSLVEAWREGAVLHPLRRSGVTPHREGKGGHGFLRKPGLAKAHLHNSFLSIGFQNSPVIYKAFTII